MQPIHVKSFVALVITGLTAGLSGCAGSTPPAAAPAAEEPSGEKNGCAGKPGEKHSCGGKMEKEHEGDAPAAPEEGKGDPSSK